MAALDRMYRTLPLSSLVGLYDACQRTIAARMSTASVDRPKPPRNLRKRKLALNVVAQVIWSSPATQLSLAGGTKHHLPGAHMLCTRAQQS